MQTKNTQRSFFQRSVALAAFSASANCWVSAFNCRRLRLASRSAKGSTTAVTGGGRITVGDRLMVSEGEEAGEGAGAQGVHHHRGRFARLQQRREALVSLKASWTDWAQELRAICLQGIADKAVDGRKMQARYCEPWFEKISAWAADGTAQVRYRGAQWTAALMPGVAPTSGEGAYRIEQVVGNRLMVVPAP